MKIIMVHGINQSDKDPETLKKIWIDAFLEGIFQAQIPDVLGNAKFELVFYGDLVKKYMRKPVSYKSLLDLQTRGLHAFLENTGELCSNEQQVLINIAEQIEGEANIGYQDQLSIDAISKNLKSILSPTALTDRFAKAIVKITSHYQKLHTWVLKLFAKEANLFLHNEQYRMEIRKLLLSKIKEEADEEIVLVGHSLGSVACLDALQHLESQFKIARFVSLGSPLGIPIFYNFFEHRDKPAALIGDWINFYAADDFVSAYLLSNPPFNVSPEIKNLRANTQYFQPHHIVGYLDDAHVGKTILGIP